MKQHVIAANADIVAPLEMFGRMAGDSAEGLMHYGKSRPEEWKQAIYALAEGDRGPMRELARDLHAANLTKIRQSLEVAHRMPGVKIFENGASVLNYRVLLPDGRWTTLGQLKSAPMPNLPEGGGINQWIKR